MMKALLLLALLGAAIGTAAAQEGDTIGSSLMLGPKRQCPDPDCYCTMEVDQVCGKDGKTCASAW